MTSNFKRALLLDRKVNGYNITIVQVSPRRYQVAATKDAHKSGDIQFVFHLQRKTATTSWQASTIAEDFTRHYSTLNA